MKKRRPEVILALDVDRFSRARYFIDQLRPEIKVFKVGPHLFVDCGPQVIEYINRKRAGVFLDLKFHDIPNTVGRAVRQAVRLKVRMLTLHASGGRQMMRAAVTSARDESARRKTKRPLLLGVTVLTSRQAPIQEVFRLAKLALDCGLDGVVCSVREAGYLRNRIKRDFVIATPGIRPKGMAADDQKRIATVEEAAKIGSDFLVVGRPILEAAEPKEAAAEILRALKK